MKEQAKGRTKERLSQAYPRMLQQVKTAVRMLEAQSAPVLTQAIQSARQSAIELGELTQDEAAAVADYIARDLHYFGRFLAETGKGLVDWLAFDSQLLEHQIGELFLSVADRSQLEWSTLQQHMPFKPEYHAGEVTGIGTLYCTGCHKPLPFYKSSLVPECPACHSKTYIRVQTKRD